MTRKMLKEKIKELTNEVRELQPLLEEIFAQMTTIQTVVPTQGPSELGADFILTRLSEELGDTEYIGVIVKIGKILQDHSQINRQIEECAIERISNSGKREIYLSEIWIAANGTISDMAKTKIFKRYSYQKIKFIDLNKLTELAEKYVPNFGLDISFSDIKLLDNQMVEAEKRDANTNLLPELQAKVYIEPEIAKISYDDYKHSEEYSNNRKVNIYNEIKKHKVLTVEAPMGGGKSRLFNKIITHYSGHDIYIEEKVVPIYLHSREVLKADFDGMDSFIDKLKIDYKLDKDSKRKFLFLVDGLDESNFSDNAGVEFVESLIDQAKSRTDTKLILATRKISEENLEQKIEEFSERYEITPLSIKKVFGFVQSICKFLNVQNRLIQDLKRSSLFKVLPRTPIAAIVLAKILQENHDELPSNLTELYSQYIELSLGRWDTHKGEGLVSHMEYEALMAILNKMAAYFMDNDISALSFEETKNFFEEYLGPRNFEFTADYLFEKVIDRSDILSIDDTYGTVSFRHKSFCEYFYAKGLDKKASVKITPLIFKPYWANSYFFYVGLKRDCPELLDEIIDLQVDSEGARFAKMMGMGDLLLAGYSSPTSIIEKGILKTFTDAASYYCEVSDKTIQSPLSVFPRMQLLALFRFILSENYSYPFFLNAITLAIEELCTRDNVLDSDAFSLFFLDIARAELGGKEVFDKLVDVSGKTLPLILQIAVKQEVKFKGKTSPAIKRLEKRLMKNIKLSAEYRKAVNSLFEDSIDDRLKFTSKGKRKNKAKRS